MNLFLANLMLFLHALLIAFLVGGFALIIVGHFRRWHWVRNRLFRLSHLGLMAFVALQTCARQPCPLTLLENRFREAAGGTGYAGGFIEYWLRQFVYHDLPPWVFFVAYTSFGVLVLGTWFWVRPDVPRASRPRL